MSGQEDQSMGKIKMEIVSKKKKLVIFFPFFFRATGGDDRLPL